MVQRSGLIGPSLSRYNPCLQDRHALDSHYHNTSKRHLGRGVKYALATLFGDDGEPMAAALAQLSTSLSKIGLTWTASNW